jgi:hypothetical protein
MRYLPDVLCVLIAMTLDTCLRGVSAAQAAVQDRGKHGAAQELRWAAALASARGNPAVELSYRDVWDAWQRDEDVVRGPGLPADSPTAFMCGWAEPVLRVHARRMLFWQKHIVVGVSS